jgi:hypothetical protein
MDGVLKANIFDNHLNNYDLQYLSVSVIITKIAQPSPAPRCSDRLIGFRLIAILSQIPTRDRACCREIYAPCGMVVLKLSMLSTLLLGSHTYAHAQYKHVLMVYQIAFSKTHELSKNVTEMTKICKY